MSHVVGDWQRQSETHNKAMWSKKSTGTTSRTQSVTVRIRGCRREITEGNSNIDTVLVHVEACLKALDRLSLVGARVRSRSQWVVEEGEMSSRLFLNGAPRWNWQALSIDKLYGRQQHRSM